jgi:hypothetical protein
MSARLSEGGPLVKVALTLQRPPSDDLQHLTRAERHRALRENSARLRSGIIRWLDERGMAPEVVRVGEPTLFNTLFVVATQRVAEQLRRAPGVTDVLPDGPVTVDL